MVHPFFAPISKHFGFLQAQYGFRVTKEQYQDDGFGAGLVRFATDRYYIDFHMQNMGPELTISTGRAGQPSTDLAWVFAYLTQSISASPSGAASWLYYYPHFSLGIWGEASIAWQVERLADILQSMWPAVFIFLDMDGPHSAGFLEFQERANRASEERAADGFFFPSGKIEGRRALNFAPLAEKSFAFLRAYEYKIIHSDPVFLRFETTGRSPASFVNIFHRLRSFQVGVQTGTVQSDPSFELNFDLEELAAWSGIPYHSYVAQNTPALQTALNRMARLFRQCAAPALSGDMRLYAALHARRIDLARRTSRAWAERNRVQELWPNS